MEELNRLEEERLSRDDDSFTRRKSKDVIDIPDDDNLSADNLTDNEDPFNTSPKKST